MSTSTHLRRPDDTVYRGERIEGPRGEFCGVRVTMDRLHFPLPPAGLKLRCASAFEWGYGGAGPKVLARALIFDVTGDAKLARRAGVWVMWAMTACWGSKWSITAGRVRAWLEQFERERALEALVPDLEDLARAGLARDADEPVVIGPIRVHAKHAAKGPHASPAAQEGGAA